jgi:hypothetical protein
LRLGAVDWQPEELTQSRKGAKGAAIIVMRVEAKTARLPLENV